MLPKCFSFVVIVILLHSLVKIVRSHHCLFVCCSYFYLFYFSYHSWWVGPKDVHLTYETLSHWSGVYNFIALKEYSGQKKLISQNYTTRQGADPIRPTRQVLTPSDPRTATKKGVMTWGFCPGMGIFGAPCLVTVFACGTQRWRCTYGSCTMILIADSWPRDPWLTNHRQHWMLGV